MLPGPTYVRQCPHCSQPVLQDSPESGNTFGASYWSDGAMDAPMLPTTPPIIECPHCHQLGWLRDFATKESYWPWTSHPPQSEEEREEQKTRERYSHAAHGLPPGCAALCAFADHTPMEANAAITARVLAWRTGNDARRDATQPAVLLQAHEIHNLHCLLRLLEQHKNAPALLLAEIHRELGHWAAAAALLATTAWQGSPDGSWAQLLMDCIEKRDPLVREIPPDRPVRTPRGTCSGFG